MGFYLPLKVCPNSFEILAFFLLYHFVISLRLIRRVASRTDTHRLNL